MPRIWRSSVHLAITLLLFTIHPNNAVAQQHQTLVEQLRDLVETPAVPGYERELSARIAKMLAGHKARIDNLGDVLVTVGSGAPHRLIAAPIDEPGYVVSGITPDGYLTLQRLPQGGELPLFNELYSAEPVKIETPQHKWINGAVAGISIHLFPQRQHPPSMADLDNMYVDVGATSAAQARSGGADVLGPLAVDRTFYALDSGHEYASPAIGDRFGAAALLEMLRTLDPGKLKGTLTVAFVTQQWLGARGLQKVLYQLKPDELIYVGRLMRAPAPPAGANAQPAQHEASPGFKQTVGSGVIIASEKPDGELTGLATDIEQAASQINAAVGSDFSAPLLPRGGYMTESKLPERTVHLSIATEWPSTPAELIDANDLSSLTMLLEQYLEGAAQKPVATPTNLAASDVPTRPTTAPSPESILKHLIETYGVSGGHEKNMRDAVTAFLPAWAKPETDNAGNLVLHWGNAGSKGPRIAVVAHMDEIGYEVHA